MELGLTGRVALVTGGSRGIGRAIAVALAREGAKVTLTYGSRREAADEAVAAIRRDGGEAEALGFDVGDPAAGKAAVESVTKTQGGLHILVNNAGVAIDNLLLRLKDDELDTLFRTNVLGPFALARAAARPMTKARWGRIINIGSVVGAMGNGGQTGYGATKAALEGMARSLARELASRNVTCNVVAPGFIGTDMTSGLPEAAKAHLLQSIPLGEMGQPEDVADAVCFLASERARYVTGQVLHVNGGLYM